jgi:hypothetical protein
VTWHFDPSISASRINEPLYHQPRGTRSLDLADH